MSLTALLEDEPPELITPPPALRRPSVKYATDGSPTEIVTGDVPMATTQAEYADAVRASCKTPIPEGSELVLVEAWFNESAWSRKKKTQENAVTRPVWRYRFKVTVKSKLEYRKSLAEMDAWVKRQKLKAPKSVTGEHAEIVMLADLQIGKVDERGGTDQLQERFYTALAETVVRIKESKPCVIVLAELGDGCENFENTPSQAGTNDRNMAAQLDMHHEFLFAAITALAPLAPRLMVVGVPSNHMEIRKDGKAVGGPENDYGLVTMASLKRSFQLNKKAYGHVEFYWPDLHEVSIVLPIAGQNVAFTHGHYSKGSGAADNVPKWLSNQFAARIARMDEATIILTGHFHHLRIAQIIGGRWWIQAPALDNGSAWLKRINGQGSSDAGILMIRVDSTGWSNPQILGNTFKATANNT